MFVLKALDRWTYLERASENVRMATVSRCVKSHIDPEELCLKSSRVTTSSLCFLIMSHRGAESLHRTLKNQLFARGVEKVDGKVCYGFKCSRDKMDGRLMKANEILHYGVLHKWLPVVHYWLSERNQQGTKTSAVWFLAGDADLSGTRG